MMKSRGAMGVLLAAVPVLLTGCAAVSEPMPVPSVTPSPTETRFDPTFTESPTPVPDGATPPDLGERTLVDVLTTYAIWSPATNEIIAFGFIPQVLDVDGTCTLKAHRDAFTISGASSSVTAEASSTQCGELALSSPDLTTGIWSVTIEYESATYAGISAPTLVELP